MVVKVYISGISGNKEVKKRQQRVLMILDSKHIPHQFIDITEPGLEDEKDFMQQNSKALEGAKYALPPQIFQDSEYCGDYEQFDLSNENDELEKFLKLSDEEVERIKSISTPRASPAKEATSISNGVGSKEPLVEDIIEFETKGLNDAEAVVGDAVAAEAAVEEVELAEEEQPEQATPPTQSPERETDEKPVEEPAAAEVEPESEEEEEDD